MSKTNLSDAVKAYLEVLDREGGTSAKERETALGVVRAELAKEKG